MRAGNMSVFTDFNCPHTIWIEIIVEICAFLNDIKLLPIYNECLL